MRINLYEKTKKRLARGICALVGYVTIIFGGFFDNSTMYVGLQSNTAITQGYDVDIADNYKYTLGIRKIALFNYQDRDKFYKGDEFQLSDNAIIGAINNWEYLVNVSSVRNQGHEYIDQEYWFKWSNNWFVTKTKYVSKESRDLEFFDYDARFRLRHNNFNFTIGAVLRAHPIYGHPAIGDYEGLWWDLAYEYGYQDYLVPLNDLNENGEIDSYYLWIETDPDTEEGYWIYYYEDADFYWEDANANTVAYSDAEFLQYHYPHVVHMYNEDNKIEEWQSEINVALGFDILFGGEKFYSHLWVNAFPESYGLTDKAYDGKDMQYDVGTVIGANLSEHIGVYIEGIYQNYYGRAEHNVMAGLNWRF